ncbi:ribonuclease III [Candidatus Thiomargarita nelsonii]|uniref:Ribonuclease 3 n=1 Tax=Candidatus Thiomargarita nelsonii TaxID=1003181 RepID=A0A0A6RYT0_9GAMM|nr:ribonuclease III [Candidatus Thiomargarita nelsonii]
MKQDYTRLCKILDYHFKQEDYLITALRHRSVGTPNNERLEFLGDALLSCVMAEELFKRFPEAREGELTRFRANLVKRDTLVKIAQQIELGKYLQLGGGELKTGGEQRASILADAVEALLGAIYLDSNIKTCQSVILQLWHKPLNNLSPRKIKDPKTRLQEYSQAKQQALPAYRVLAINGTPHAQEFEVECIISGLAQPTYGSGESRRRAEQSAAAKALGILHVE